MIIDRATSLQIEGKGWKTIVLAGRGGPAFVIERSIGVIIDMLTVITGAVSRRGLVGAGTAIVLSTTVGTIIERCVLLQLGLLEPPGQPPGDQPGDPGQPEDPCPPEILKRFVGREALLADLRAPFGAKGFGGPVIALQGLVLETLIQENVIVGTTGIGSLGADLGTSILAEPGALGDPTYVKPWGSADNEPREEVSYLLTVDLAIEDNLLVCWLTGVSLEGFAAHEGDARITGNAALVCLRAGFATTGVVGTGGRVDIARNVVRGLGVGHCVRRRRHARGRERRQAAHGRREHAQGGLTRCAGHGDVARLRAVERVDRARGGVPGAVRRRGDRRRLRAASTRIERAQIRGNRVVGVIGDGIALRTRVVSVQINGNVVQQVGGDGITMSEKATAEEVAIEDNQLFEIGGRAVATATCASSARSSCATSSTPSCSATRSASSVRTRHRRSAGSACSPSAPSTCAWARTRSSTWAPTSSPVSGWGARRRASSSAPTCTTTRSGADRARSKARVRAASGRRSASLGVGVSGRRPDDSSWRGLQQVRGRAGERPHGPLRPGAGTVFVEGEAGGYAGSARRGQYRRVLQPIQARWA